MTEPTAHGFLFTATSILAALDNRKHQTRRVVTWKNSLIDGSGKGGRWHWAFLQWEHAIPLLDQSGFWVPCSRPECKHTLKSTELVPGAIRSHAPAHYVTPRYQVGDLLWGKETWRAVMGMWKSWIEYKAGGPEKKIHRDAFRDLKKLVLRFPGARKDRHSDAWRGGLFMPRKFSRFERPIVRVGAERVQDISEADAFAEGVPVDANNGDNLDRPLDDEWWCPTCFGHGVHAALGEGYGVTEVDCSDCDTAPKLFRNLWQSINGKKPGRDWASNPAVWPVEWES